MVTYATLGSRAVAAIVDHIILFIITAILTIPMGLSMMPYAMNPSNPFNVIAMASAWVSYAALSFVIWLVYFTYFEGTTGQTPGKSAVHIKVTKMKGGRLNYVDAFIRSLLRIIDNLPFLYILGIILVAATEKNQRLGDLAANTIVVKA